MFDIQYGEHGIALTFGTMDGVREYLWDHGLHPSKWELIDETKTIWFKGGPTKYKITEWSMPEVVDEKAVDKMTLEWSRRYDEAKIAWLLDKTPENRVKLEMLLADIPTYTDK